MSGEYDDEQKIEDMKEQIDKYDEMSSYFIINEIGGFIWRMNHDMANGRIPTESHKGIDDDIAFMSKVQQYAVSQLNRFGVEKPYRNENKQPSAEYWAWFKWWDSHIKNLPDSEWKELNILIKEKKDCSKYWPKGNWRDNIPEEEKGIKEAEAFFKKA